MSASCYISLYFLELSRMPLHPQVTPVLKSYINRETLKGRLYLNFTYRSSRNFVVPPSVRPLLSPPKKPKAPTKVIEDFF